MIRTCLEHLRILAAKIFKNLELYVNKFDMKRYNL